MDERLKKISPSEMGMSNDQWEVFVQLHGMPGDEYFIAEGVNKKTEDKLPHAKEDEILADEVKVFLSHYEEDIFETPQSLIDKQMSMFDNT